MAHDASTQSSVRFGPKRSTSQPQMKLATIAMTVNISEMNTNWDSSGPSLARR